MNDSSQKRSKMAQEYDQALANNSVDNGAKGDGLQQHARNDKELVDDGFGRSHVEGNNAVGSGAGAASTPGTAPPSKPAQSVQENATTHSESKLATGEELREREFPVPTQNTVASEQSLIVDQETMADEGPRSGGTVGTVPGDQARNGVVGDILDQNRDTPDFPQQR